MNIQSLSDYFDITENSLNHFGVFNRFIGKDVNLYVDPFLFDNLNIPEFIDSRKHIKDHFSKVIKFLQYNTPRTIKESEKLLTFKEIRGIGLGYGKDTDNGKSIGIDLAKRLVKSGKEIVDMGITDPEIFEILGLFEEGFGADRLSDITINILKNNFLNYTNRLTKELGIKKTKEYSLFNGSKVNLPYVKERKTYILLVPSCVLKELPTAYDRDGIDYVVSVNEELRQKLNHMLGNIRRKEIKKIKKSEIKEIIMRDPENIKTLIRCYRNKTRFNYDFQNDNKGKIKWYDIGKEIAKENPLSLAQNELSEIDVIVRKIISQVKQSVEYNGANIHFFDKENKPLHEKYFQSVFLIIAQSYCKSNNLDISPESNKGRGPVDFKFSRGNNKITVEIKKDSNNLIHGIEKQLPIYQKSEDAQKSIYIIFRVTKDGKQIDNLRKFEEIMKKEGKNIPEYHVIDARLVESASNAKEV